MGFGSGGGSHLRNTWGPHCCTFTPTPAPAGEACPPPFLKALSFPSYTPPTLRSPAPGIHQGGWLSSHHVHAPGVQLFPVPACSPVAHRTQLQGGQAQLTVRPWASSEPKEGRKGSGLPEARAPPAPPTLLGKNGLELSSHRPWLRMAMGWRASWVSHRLTGSPPGFREGVKPQKPCGPCLAPALSLSPHPSLTPLTSISSPRI